MVSLGFTADQDNAELVSSRVQKACAAMERAMPWQVAEPKEQVLINSFNELKRVADRVIAVAHFEIKSFWVLQNEWSGFPDPSEFALVGICRQGEINAEGYFEDWPDAGSRPDGT